MTPEIKPGQTWVPKYRPAGSVKVTVVTTEKVGFITKSGGNAYLRHAKFRAIYRPAQ